MAPPPALRARVLAAFDARERGEGVDRPAGRLLWLRPALVGASAAAAAVLALGFAGGVSFLPGGDAAPAQAARGSTRWATIAEAPASSSAPFRFIDDPSLPLRLPTAGPLDGP